MIKIEDGASNSFTSHYKPFLWDFPTEIIQYRTKYFGSKTDFFSTMCEIFYHKLDISRKTIPEDVAMGAKGQCNWFTILLVFIVAKFDYSI